jgi:hypothetical protein
MFFSRKIKGSIGFICGLVFIVVGVKFVGVLFQAYGVYEFFKYNLNLNKDRSLLAFLYGWKIGQ